MDYEVAATMRNVVGLAVVGLLIGSISGCGGQQGSDESDAPLPADDAPPVSSELDTLEIFDEEFVRAVDSLQLGIDLAIEDGVQACMADEGFEYVPLPRSEVARNLGMADAGDGESDILDHFDHAIMALDMLNADGTEPSDPNADISNSLSPEEQERYAFAKSDCLVEASHENSNPLASEKNWFGEAVDEAAARTAASSEVVAATEEFNRCFSAYGYGTVEEIEERYFNEVDMAMQQFRSGEITEDATREALGLIAEEELEISTAYEECYAPRRQVVEDIYAENFAEIAERDSDKAAVWAAEFKDLIDPYLARLEE
jgi:hypothetical protein